jgi:hypothetical protein
MTDVKKERAPTKRMSSNKLLVPLEVQDFMI